MTSVLDYQKNYNKLKNRLLPKFCFYDDQSCSDVIIRAHSIQKRKILSSIAENGHVLKFLPSPNNLLLVPTEIGINKASTFTGFCKKHDNDIFKGIEENDYISGNKEQQFLFSYRALAFECHAKTFQLQYSKEIYNACINNDENYLIKNLSVEEELVPDYIQQYTKNYKKFLEGSKDVLSQLEILRSTFKINLNKRRFYKIKTFELQFDKKYEITASGLPAIEYDLYENMINDIPRIHSYLAFLFVTVIPLESKTVILLSCQQKDYSRYELFFHQINNLNSDKKKTIISTLLVGYIENFFISPRLWCQLSSTQKEDAIKIYNITIGRKPINLFKDLSFNIFIDY